MTYSHSTTWRQIPVSRRRWQSGTIGIFVESGGDLASAQERLLHEIVVGGADNAQRRQAAYCGLHVLGALSKILTTSGIYHPGPPHIGLYDGLSTRGRQLNFFSLIG